MKEAKEEEFLDCFFLIAKSFRLRKDFCNMKEANKEKSNGCLFYIAELLNKKQSLPTQKKQTSSKAFPEA